MTTSSRITASLLIALLTTVGGPALAATAEPLEIDADVLAMLAKEKARVTAANGQAASAARRGASNDPTQAECGSINIGNVISGGRIGFAPTDVNVVILGDVVNANNKCK